MTDLSHVPEASHDPTLLLLGIGAGCILTGLLWAVDAWSTRRELVRVLGRLELAERKLAGKVTR